MSMINVKTEGATGNGVDDDWQVLQNLINDAEGALYFPPGRYRINSTLVFPNRTGYHLVGCGLAERVPFTSPARGCESVIVWGGGSGGTMIEYQGIGLVWNGLGLWGCNWPGSSSSCPGPRASVGILIKRPSTSDVLETGKVWFGSLLVEDCVTAVATDLNAANIADEVAFGYFWPKGCGTAVRLNHEKSVNFTFEYVHAEDCATIFHANNGGRIFTQAVRVLPDNTAVLRLTGGNATGAFFHINGLAVDAGVEGIHLLRNIDSGNGTQHVRFTNAHFVCSDTTACPPASSSSGVSTTCYPVEVVIERSNSSTGKTVLELVGCRGLAALDANVTIRGANSSNKSHLIVRESEIFQAGFLIDQAASSNYTYAGLENWTFPCGIGDDDSGSG